jgi:hypothetical protein
MTKGGHPFYPSPIIGVLCSGLKIFQFTEEEVEIMNKKQIFIFSTVAALTAVSPRVNAADAEVKADVKLPRAEAQADLDVDRDRTAANRADRLDRDRDRDKVSKMNKATGILGMEVRNKQNEKLGEVKDLVMDINSGKVSYAVLAVGGFLGVGEKLIALPPGALQAGQDMGYLTLDADKAKIQAAPGFAATAWPSHRDPEIRRFWSDVSATGSPASAETSRDRRTLDVDVDRRNNGVKGEVNVDRKKKIYTDADKDDDKKVKVEIDKD